jgi:hypothetical protein
MDQEAVRTVRIVIDSSGAKSGGAEVENALKSIDDRISDGFASIQKFGESFESLKSYAEGFIGVKIAEKFLEMFENAGKAALAQERLAQSLGVSTTFVQAATYAANQNGIGTDTMTTAMTRFSNAVGQASQGNKQAIDTFQSLGVYLLDAQGKIRPTEIVLSDVAAALLKVDDPAKRVALSIQLFGRSGAEVIPMLKDLAAGSDVLASKAAAAGVIIDNDVVEQLKKLEAQSEASSSKWHALVLNIGTPIATAAMEAVNSILGEILGKLQQMDAMRHLADQGVLPQNEQDAVVANYNRLRAKALDPANKRNASIQHAYDKASQAFENMTKSAGSIDNVPDPAERMRILAEQNAAQLSVSGSFPTDVPDKSSSPGVSNPADKAAGESLDARLKKLTNDAQIALDGAKAMAFASDQGADALSKLEVHTKDLQQVSDAYIKSGQSVKLVFDAQTGALTTNNAAVNAQVKALDDLNDQTKIQNALRDIGVKAYSLQQQNDETQLQLQLQGQTTDEIARQLAIHKEIADAKAKGVPLDSQQLQSLQAAVNRQYDLKEAIDATQKSTQLWLAPFSQAVNGIQTSFEGLFENILKDGKNVWQTFADTIKNIFIKLFAELAVIAVVRPILQPIVQGVFSPAAAEQLGFGQGVGSGGIGSILGGGGGLSPGLQGSGGGLGNIGLPSGGGFGGGNMFGLGDFLARPIGSFFQSTPDVGSLIASGQTGASVAAGGPGGLSSLSGLSVGQGFSGALSIGTGALSLAQSNGDTGKTIGGIGQMVGGALMMIPTPWTMAAGAIISLASSILPSVLGGGPKIPPMPDLGYSQGSFNYDSNNAVYTGGENAAGALAIGQSVLSLISRAGGTPIAGQLYGGTVASGTTHTWNGQQWVGQNYTQADISSPTGQVTFIPGTGPGVSVQDAADKLVASAFRADVLNGAVKGVSDTLKNIFETVDPANSKAAQDVVDFAKTYDQLGKATNTVKDAVDQLNQKFQTLSQQAIGYGQSIDPVNAELAKETKRTAQDFIDNMLDPLAVQMRALQDAEDSALASAKYINDNVAGVYADTNAIVDYYGKQRLALEDQFYQGGITNIQNAIQRLTFGDLANASPTTQLAGVKASYQAGLAQAQTGDVSAIANLANLAIGYAQAQQRYSGSGPEYAALAAQLRQQLGDVLAVASGGAAPAGTAADPQQINTAVQVLQANISQLQQIVQTLAEKVDKQSNDNAVLVAQLRSATTNGM